MDILLYSAISKGDLQSLRELLTSNKEFDLNTLLEITNCTILCYASTINNLEIVELLVEFGADVNFADSNGHTPLMYACYFNFTEIIIYYLRCGSDINQKSLKGNSAFVYYYLTHDIEQNWTFIRRLINIYGADINAIDDYAEKTNILMLAIYQRYFDIATELIGLGADINTRDINGNNILAVSIRLLEDEYRKHDDGWNDYLCSNNDILDKFSYGSKSWLQFISYYPRKELDYNRHVNFLQFILHSGVNIKETTKSRVFMNNRMVVAQTYIVVNALNSYLSYFTTIVDKATKYIYIQIFDDIMNSLTSYATTCCDTNLVNELDRVRIDINTILSK